MGLLQGGQGRAQGVVLRPAAVQLLLDGLPPGLKGLPVAQGIQLPLGHGQAAAQPGELSLRRAQAGRGLGRGQSGAPRPSRRRPPRAGAGCRPGFWPLQLYPGGGQALVQVQRPGEGGGYAEGVRHRGGEGVHQLQQPPAGLPRPGRCARPGPAPPPPAFGRLPPPPHTPPGRRWPGPEYPRAAPPRSVPAALPLRRQIVFSTARRRSAELRPR